MLIHVTLRYEEGASPVQDPAAVRQLVAFARRMEDGSAHPDVRVVSVHWAAQRPVAAYAVLEAPAAEAVEAFLAGMPRPASVDLHEVVPLASALADGAELLATAAGGAR